MTVCCFMTLLTVLAVIGIVCLIDNGNCASF